MIAAFLLIGVIIFATLAHGAVEIWAVAILQAIIIIGVATQLIFLTRQEKAEILKTPLELPILIFLGLAGVSYIISACPGVTRMQVVKILVYALLFYGVINAIRTRRQLLALVNGLVVFGVCYASAGMIVSGEHLFGIKIFSAGQFNISLTFPNHSHFAGFLELILWLCLGLAFIYQGSKRILFLCFAVYMAVALGFSLSRGGFIGFWGGFVFFTVAMACSRQPERKLLFIMAFVVGAGAIMTWLGAEPFLERIKTLRNPLAADPVRIMVWRQTLDMIADYPAVGAGLGMFPHIFPQYQPSALSKAYTNHAHNDYLELAAEMGLIGLIVALIIVILLFGTTLKRLFSVSAQSYRIIGVGALAGCFSLLVHAFGDYHFHIPANAALFVICAGIAVVSARLANPAAVVAYRHCDWLHQRRTMAAMVILSMAAIALSMAAIPMLSRLLIRQALAHQDAKNYPQALQSARQAAMVAPDCAEAMTLMGDLAAKQFQADRQTETIALALQCYDQALARCPVKSVIYTKKARAAVMAAQYPAAETALQTAIVYDPANPQSHYDLAAFYLDRHKLSQAYPVYRNCLSLDAAYLPIVLQALWAADSEYAQLKQAIPEKADLRKQFALFLFAKGYRQAGKAELELMFALDATSLRAADHLQQLLRLNEYESALSAAQQYTAAFPHDRPLQKQLAQLYERLNKPHEAILIYQELIRSNADDNNSYLILSNLYLKIKNYDKGIELVREGVTRFPRQADFYLALSRLYGLTQQPDQATAILIKGLAASPDSPALRLALADCYRQAKQPEKTLEILKALVIQYHTNPYYYYVLGDEYRRHGLLYQAAEQWRQCLAIRPDDAACRAGLNSIFRQLGINSPE